MVTIITRGLHSSRRLKPVQAPPNRKYHEILLPTDLTHDLQKYQAVEVDEEVARQRRELIVLKGSVR